MTTEYAFIDDSGVVRLEGTLSPDPAAGSASPTFTGTVTADNLTAAGNVALAGAAKTLGFYNHAPTALQTGVAVTAAGIHAALVNLGLITA
jgi:hypothetical protein